MSATIPTSSTPTSRPTPPTSLPFPPLTKTHILACSYPSWYPQFRSHTPKARIIPLPAAFTAYLRSDGIILPPSQPSTPRPLTPTTTSDDDDEGFFSSTSHASSDASIPSSTSSTSTASTSSDPSLQWPQTHALIRSTLASLGGSAVPKLNWSAPKDATWIVAGNSLQCRTPNDVYLLLKSSDFVTHDLEHAFDGCVDWSAPSPSPPPSREDVDQEQEEEEEQERGGVVGSSSSSSRGEKLEREIGGYVLVLRKWFQLNPSLEFRVFVREGKVLGLGQRDLNHYEFLFDLRARLRKVILTFWEREVKGVFTQDSYTMDVYVPPPHERCWVVDFNPWDQRTDPGTWSWLELLKMDAPVQVWSRRQEEAEAETGLEGETARLYLNGTSTSTRASDLGEEDEECGGADSDASDEDVETLYDTIGPEFRLVERNDPEAYMFNSTRYSAHKLPRDVVDASQSGAGGLREFANQWKEILEKRMTEERIESDADDDDDDDDDD